VRPPLELTAGAARETTLVTADPLGKA
jgi:hypothetical protein